MRNGPNGLPRRSRRRTTGKLSAAVTQALDVLVVPNLLAIAVHEPYTARWTCACGVCTCSLQCWLWWRRRWRLLLLVPRLRGCQSLSAAMQDQRLRWWLIGEGCCQSLKTGAATQDETVTIDQEGDCIAGIIGRNTTRCGGWRRGDK